jgi:hypothetical protein
MASIKSAGKPECRRSGPGPTNAWCAAARGKSYLHHARSRRWLSLRNEGAVGLLPAPAAPTLGWRSRSSYFYKMLSFLAFLSQLV